MAPARRPIDPSRRTTVLFTNGFVVSTWGRDMVESNHGGSAIDGMDVAAIRRYLAETGICFAVLFGSRVRGETHDSSDVDAALRFLEELLPKERFRRRNRIDTELQGYADDFVDVSDIQDLFLLIARAALQKGILPGR